MKVLSVANTLREIRLDQIDDKFTEQFFSVIATDAPEDMGIKTDCSGIQIIEMINAAPFEYRKKVLDTIVFEGDDIGEFYAEVSEVRDRLTKEDIFNDSVQGNFVIMMSLIVIVLVGVSMFIYVSSSSIRGELPESKILPILEKVAQSITKDSQTIDNEINDATAQK